MINRAAIDKIDRHIEDALAKGASILGTRPALPDGDHYAAPVVLANANTDMLLANEETFGPVAPLFRFDREDEAIAIANGTPFGLAAYFYTQGLKRAWRVGEALEFGMVGLNTGVISMEVAPFGGVKQSGIGREGGQAGIEEYLESRASTSAASTDKKPGLRRARSFLIASFSELANRSDCLVDGPRRGEMGDPTRPRHDLAQRLRRFAINSRRDRQGHRTRARPSGG